MNSFIPARKQEDDSRLDRITTKVKTTPVFQGCDARGISDYAVVQMSGFSRRQPMTVNEIEALSRSLARNQFIPTIYPVPKDHKFCSGCGDWVRCAGFSADRRNRDGLQAHCKTCRNAHERKMYRYRQTAAAGAGAGAGAFLM